MSGFVRTLEKRIMKRRGLARQTQRIVHTGGRPTIVRLKRGEGSIVDVHGNIYGRRWPRAPGPARIVQSA